MSLRAERDLRRMGAGANRQRVRQALESLGENTPNLDIKALQGHSPWLRMRIGDYLILFRPITEGEEDERSYLVARIVHRRDLAQAVDKMK